jgi:hypothetical protein
MPRALTIAAAILLAWCGCHADTNAQPASGQTGLDAFMAQVLAKRDENWRRLQQYVLDEHESAEVMAPGRMRLFGLRREYTWYIRDGVFVRSPLRFDGVTIGEADRREYEKRWLAREQRRARRPDQQGAEITIGGMPPQAEASDTPGDVDALVRIAREPQFVSVAYFLRFKFEPGQYAFAGREQYEGREVYRIEYYPTRLYDDHEEGKDTGTSAESKGAAKDRRRHERPSDPKERELEARLSRQMNKVALVTLWIEPSAHQIVKYVFDNVGFDFLPGRWLVRLDEARASMRMSEAFPGVWLPGGIEFSAGMTLASGGYTLRYGTEYTKYRQAEVEVRIR